MPWLEQLVQPFVKRFHWEMVRLNCSAVVTTTYADWQVPELSIREVPSTKRVSSRFVKGRSRRPYWGKRRTSCKQEWVGILEEGGAEQ